MKTKTKRQRFWRCAWCENDWDQMGLRYAWCKNEKCHLMECNCRTVLLMRHCPWFKKADNKGALFEVTDDDKKEIEDFKKTIEETTYARKRSC